MADDRWLVCPMCGLSRKLVKSGVGARKPLGTIKGLPRFDVVNPDTGVFIDHRDISGGRGSGFTRLSIETLMEVKNNLEYRDLLEQLKNQCNIILESLKNVE